MSYRRMAAWSAIGFVILNVAGFALGGSPPGPEDGPGAIAEYIDDGGTTLKAGLAVSALATLLFIPFIAGLVAAIRAGDRDRGEAYGLVVLIAAVLAGAFAGVGMLANAALALRGGTALDAPTTRLAWDLSMIAYGISMTFVVPLGLATAAAVLQRGILPRWFGTLSAVVGVVALSGFFSIVSGSTLSSLAFLGYAGLLVWTLAAGTAMLREPDPVVA